MLWALGWLGDREVIGDPRTELVLVQYLLDECPELREASARAMGLTPPDRARMWLTRRLRDEPDHEVRRTISLKTSCRKPPPQSRAEAHLNGQ